MDEVPRSTTRSLQLGMPWHQKPLLLFRDKLLRYGYLDQHSDRYSDVAYVIREVMTFKVEEGFPRIIENDLVPGVGSVRYRLALSACEPWRRTLHELHKAVTDTTSGNTRMMNIEGYAERLFQETLATADADG